MKTATVKSNHHMYDLYSPSGELIAITNSTAGIMHTLKRYGYTGYIFIT
jgi:hypothetical protein